MDHVKLVALDLDGTLLHTDKSISEYTISVLNRCSEKGVLVAVATSRSETASKRVIERVKPAVIISSGGAKIRYQGDVVYRSVMPAALSDRLMKDLVESDKVGDITAETDDGYFVSYPGEALHPDYAHGIYHDFSVPLGQACYKITTEIFDDITAENLKRKYPECSFVRFSGEDWYKFADKHVSKAHAVKELANILQIDTKETAAFGDDYIDADILTECGIGVAMGNAVPELKEIADFVCDTNDNDGVAKWLEKNIL